ncbi:hypothetical protein [Caballeronia sp. LZ035]|uniref:hypothetical protein n=1 Tax=Caballeronia sp. LZ035 TaxID=3038568 RepID=UPI002854D945|nr:hypothetical protein [Caballeronia sp. LZ035]MDR5760979.1 hypothetical protein [Caballeronia sp. LZ035]
MATSKRIANAAPVQAGIAGANALDGAGGAGARKRSSGIDVVRPGAGVDSKSLLESLGVVDDLMQRKGLSNQQATLAGVRHSILRQLASVHGLDADALTLPQLSGPEWVKRFPDSRSTAELERTFKTGVDAFIKSMQDGHATVKVSSTYRPLERAYLMHYAYALAHDEVKPKDVPAQSGVDIVWDHGDPAASKRAAQAMVDAYDIAKEPALHSRHTEHKAIDMTIYWAGTLTLVDGDGTRVTIDSGPRDGTNRKLVKVGKTFGVVKAMFAGDPPHWSSDGH